MDLMGLASLIYNIGISLKKNSGYLIYGRNIVLCWALEHLCKKNNDTQNVLDIGCAKGDDLLGIKSACSESVQLYGLETYEPYRKIAIENGINVTAFDLEKDRMPFNDGFFDIIILNQILEHTKELFFVFDELSRVLKPDGILIIGVPNLAAWHDRLMLLLGDQRTGIKVLGPHIRGFTLNGFKKFIEITGSFKVENVKGAGFLPFPVFMAKILAHLYPTFATSLFLKVKHQKSEKTFADTVRERKFETNFRISQQQYSDSNS
jgi:SAM-dependent methyltransferase